MDGEPTDPKQRADLLEAYRLMVLMRRFDEKAISLQRQGRLGTLSVARGQEATIAGSVLELDPARDWVVPQYRELTALTHHGFPLANVFCHYMGNSAGDAIPEGVRMLPVQISLAAQLPHAVGLGWAERLNGGDGVVLVFFGDGASSEGDFHEACNLAGIVKAPVIFVLQNNGWAISTPRSRQSAAPTFASRASGYGIEGALVDGNDLDAVRSCVRDAVAHARAGNGPTLIEAVAYRLGAHSTADDPSRYVPAAELDAAEEQDPVPLLGRQLEEQGWLDEDGQRDLDEQVRTEIAEALAEAERRPRATLADLMRHVYAHPPSRLAAQIEAAEGLSDA